jgi:hypothetical protein
LGKCGETISDAVMSVSEDTLCREWDKIAFSWNVCFIALGSHMEHQWRRMLGHCYGALFPISDQNKKK